MNQHSNLVNMEQDDPSGLWCLNFIFHMIDNFDKKKLIADIKLEDITDNPYYAMLKKTVVEERVYNFNLGKTKFKPTTTYSLHVDREFIEMMYKDQIEDKTITTNYLEIILLHEFAHLKYFHHKKKFIREWKNLVSKWFKVKGEKGGINYLDSYFRKERKKYKYDEE